MTRSRRGFTLVELLVVISIIALLIAILIPSLKGARDQAKRIVCASNQRSIVQATLLYANDNNDVVPRNQGSEPSYVYVRGGSGIQAPGNEWHLGELLMPMMNMDPIRRDPDTKKFDDDEMRRTESAGAVFYCPATGHANDPRFRGWNNPTVFGAFMDYANIWHFTGAETAEFGGFLYPTSGDFRYVLLDDQQQEVAQPGAPYPNALFRLPFNVSRRDHVSLPNSGARSRVPLISEYVTSFNKQVSDYPAEVADGLLPEGGNHRSTGRSSGSRVKVLGGNYGFMDGHVEWRNSAQLLPRLVIDKEFQGGTRRPTYWW